MKNALTLSLLLVKIQAYNHGSLQPPKEQDMNFSTHSILFSSLILRLRYLRSKVLLQEFIASPTTMEKENKKQKSF